MNETQLMTIMGVIADPEKNVYDLSTRKNRQEIENKMLSIKKLATFKLVLSNN